MADGCYLGLGWAGLGRKTVPERKTSPMRHVEGTWRLECTRAGGTRDKNGRIAGARKGFIFLAEVLSDHFF